MSSRSSSPVRGIDWTQVLRDAGIPEPPWDKTQDSDAPMPKVQAAEPEDRENWMHV
jgi:hypothetical protein